MDASVFLRAVEVSDADALFPLIYQTGVTSTICWDGPKSFEDYREGLRKREMEVKDGFTHLFTIVERSTGRQVGSIDIRPYNHPYLSDMGLWIGMPFQGKGYATEAIRQIAAYGFEKLRMEKIEAKIFVGNIASRRAFEKNGFQLEGTIRKGVHKAGEYIDEWLFGLTREDFARQN
jgi:ribosomal-protein-alanine N-acetyltransferase